MLLWNIIFLLSCCTRVCPSLFKPTRPGNAVPPIVLQTMPLFKMTRAG